MKKFVINLKRRPDRLETFKNQCPFTDVEIVHGFDGKHMNLEPLAYERLMVDRFRDLRNGEIGVFISHLRIFKSIVENNYPMALIFEDDVIFCDNFLDKFNNILKEIPSDADIFYVGGRFTPDYCMRDGTMVSNNIIRHNTTNKQWLGSNMDKDRTMHAYIISFNLAKKCLDTFHSSKLIRNAVDSWILNLCLENSIDVYNSYPLLCHSPIQGDSDIR
uniref:Glycosyl transferase family 25 domain-containing protein n=1 Tax=viral metagenome TaxID=1070528 RepID=A0A6C0DKH7_9ZZZZ